MANRIVSLISSATEIVQALGAEHELVGRSHECDYPESVKSLPSCSLPRIDIHASSREIDEQIKQSLMDALSIYNVDRNLLATLQPTHVITQTQCEVCAVSLSDVQQALADLVGSPPEVVSLEPNSLKDIWGDIQRVADAIGRHQQGVELIASLNARLLALQDQGKDLGIAPPTLACIEWIDPLMIAGNWVPELVEIAGGHAVLGQAGVHSPYFSWEELVKSDPDVIAFMPCGFDIQRTIAELGVVFENPLWFELKAVRQGRVYVTDGNQYFNRPGPRIVESAEILNEILFDPGRTLPTHRHHATGWLRLEEC